MSSGSIIKYEGIFLEELLNYQKYYYFCRMNDRKGEGEKRVRDEKILLCQLREGSHQAFQHLYESYFDLLYGFIFRLSRSHQLTTEIVQITFTKVWNSHTQVLPEEPFKAWLFKIGKNELINALKKQWNDPLFVDFLAYRESESMSVEPDDCYDFNRFKSDLQTAKQKLSFRQRLIFELYHEQGLSAKEISEQLEINEQSVYNHLSKALAVLRNELRTYGSMLLLFFLMKL